MDMGEMKGYKNQKPSPAYHDKIVELLKLPLIEGIKGGAKNTYENVKEKVEKDYKKSEAEYKYFDLADKLVTLAYEHADSLEIAAEEIGIEIQESNFFSRNNASDLLAEPKVLTASFDEEAIKSGQNSEAIELSNNHLIVLQVVEHLPAKKKPLETIELSDLGIDATPSFRTIGYEAAPARQKGIMVNDVSELVGALKEKGLLT